MEPQDCEQAFHLRGELRSEDSHLKKRPLAKLFMTIFLHDKEKNMKIINGELHNIFVSKCLIDERYRNKRVKFFWK